MKPKASLPWIATTSCAKHRYHHRHLFLLLLLASFPSNFTANEGISQHVACVQSGKDIPNCGPSQSMDKGPAGGYGYAATKEKKEESARNKIHGKHSPKAMECPECPKAMECPLEPGVFTELKATVPQAIRERLRQLSKKVPTIESAAEIAHSLDILKLFDEPIPDLEGIRKEVHELAQKLRTAFHRIGKHMTAHKSGPSDDS